MEENSRLFVRFHPYTSRNGTHLGNQINKAYIHLIFSDDELAKRMQARPISPPTAERGYHKLFLDTVTQADQGVDFDFLRAVNMTGKTPRSK